MGRRKIDDRDYKTNNFLTEDQIFSFWLKVIKKGEDDCWLWTGSSSSNGYGSFRVRGPRINTALSPHVVSFIITHNCKPVDQVLHTCDNRPCVNPNHLYDGTQKQNIHDMIRKNNFAPMRFGFEHPHSRPRLT